MIGVGMLAAGWALWALWRYRRGRNPQTRNWRAGCSRSRTPFIVLAPLSASTFGWIFTEMGRQPWVVFGEQLTADAVSPLLTPRKCG